MIDIAELSSVPRCFTCASPAPAYVLLLGGIPFPQCCDCGRELTRVVHEAIGKTLSRRRTGEG